MEIRDQVAVVTGAARGIGRATAVALARAGARGVALADRDEEGLALCAAEAEKLGAKALAVPTDVRSASELERLLDRTTSALGAFRILHNNAGLITGTPLWPDVAPERIEALLDVNLKAVILGTRLALPRMREAGGGVIVHTASMAARAPLPPEAVYCASKAGVVMFTQACAPLAGSHGVRVCCVCPGVVETPMLRESGRDGELADYLRPIYEAVSVLDPGDVAEAVLGLIRDDAAAGVALDLANPELGQGAAPHPPVDMS